MPRWYRCGCLGVGHCHLQGIDEAKCREVVGPAKVMSLADSIHQGGGAGRREHGPAGIETYS